MGPDQHESSNSRQRIVIAMRDAKLLRPAQREGNALLIIGRRDEDQWRGSLRVELDETALSIAARHTAVTRLAVHADVVSDVGWNNLDLAEIDRVTRAQGNFHFAASPLRFLPRTVTLVR